ncbi:MAG: DUF3795 domain-containing protein [Candidatus Coatesbacteria bacterium]|nr:DUF3795 domain-containing protein [Candidatus Coatesbacteria bacterium]
MEDKEKLMGCCGLYCGDCFIYKGEIADLARDLRKVLRSERFEKVAEAISKNHFFKVLEKYEDCYEVLGGLVKFRCKKACVNGGGNPYCQIRICCTKKGLKGCWECDEIDTCKHHDEFMQSFHKNAMRNNIKKIKKKGLKEFLSGKREW